MAAPAARTAPAAPDAGEDAGRTGDAHSRSPAVPDIADDLADMLRRGRMAGVKRISRLMWIDEDGHESSIALPVPKAGETIDDGQLNAVSISEYGREILDALGETPDDWVLGEEVCRRIGGHATTDRTFYRETGKLKTAGLIDSVPRRGFRLLDKDL